MTDHYQPGWYRRTKDGTWEPLLEAPTCACGVTFRMNLQGQLRHPEPWCEAMIAGFELPSTYRYRR